MKTSSKKAKGRRLQQEVCEEFSRITGLSWGEDQPIESRGMGQHGVDIRLDKEALKLLPYSTECKNQEKWSVHEWIKQAKENQKEGTDWLLVCSRNRAKPVVILDFYVFTALLEKNLKH